MDSKEHPTPAGTGAGRETKQVDASKLPPCQLFTTEIQSWASNTRFAIAQSLLGDILVHPSGLHCKCPGLSNHSNPTRERDCRVYLDRVPTIRCLHNSCAGAVAEANHALRSAIGKAESGRYVPTPVYRKSDEQTLKELEQKEAARLAEKARANLPKILAAYPWPPEQIFSDSPDRLADDPRHDWRLLLSLFRKEENLWIGEKTQSGSRRFAHLFRTAAEWLESERCPAGPFILPATLKPGVHSRTKEDIATLPFLVVESDDLDKESMGAVFRWLREAGGLTLHAVVDTGGKSLHGWFSRPDAKTLRELTAVLPAMQCDGAVLRETQPVRLPGCLRPDSKRPGKRMQQALLYFNREGRQ